MGEECPNCGKEQSHNQKANWTCECGATVHGSVPKQASFDRAFRTGWSVVKESDGPKFVAWASANDESEEAFFNARECHICGGELVMNGLICMSCEDKYEWEDGSLGEGFYLKR